MKKVIRLTEGDLVRIIKRVVTESTTDSIKDTNNKYILEPSYDLIDKSVKDVMGVKSNIKGMVQDYVNTLNGYSPNILQQIKNGDGSGSAELYLKTLTSVIMKKLNDLGGVMKFAITKYYNKEELRKLLIKNKNKIGDIYESMLVTTLMWLHDANKPNEVKWYDGAHNTLINRKDSYINQIINVIINSLYK